MSAFRQPLRFVRSMSTSVRVMQAPVPVATKPSSQSGTVAPRDQLSQLERYPAHPLLAFFRRYPQKLERASHVAVRKETESGEEYVAHLPEAVHVSDLGKDPNARAWLAGELRLKSSKDLHTLWYVLLRERNRLATSWEELGRIGGRQAARMMNTSLPYKNHRVRKAMARIKLVLNERRLALIQAQKQVRQDASEDAPPAQDGPLFEAEQPTTTPTTTEQQ